MSNYPVEKRRQAYAQLAEVAVRLGQVGRSTRSAGVKPQLQRVLEGFDELALGFRSFRDFLEAAADAGYVRLVPVDNAPDVEVLPLAASEQTVLAPKRIRHDLWTAFVDWRAGWLRLYDPQTDAIGWLPANEVPGEATQYVELRRLYKHSTERLVLIEPIDRETTLVWVREFIANLQPRNEALEAALSTERPIQAFLAAARNAHLIDAWSVVRLRRVRDRIEAWQQKNELTFDLEREHRAIPGPRRSRSEVSARSLSITDNELRDLVTAAVERMSRAELLRLALPLEYVVSD